MKQNSKFSLAINNIKKESNIDFSDTFILRGIIDLTLAIENAIKNDLSVSGVNHSEIRTHLIQNYNVIGKYSIAQTKKVLETIITFLEENHGEHCTITTFGKRTAQHSYNNKIQYDLEQLRRFTTPLHELTHELDQKLAWKEMIRFINEEFITNDEVKSDLEITSNSLKQKMKDNLPCSSELKFLRAELVSRITKNETKKEQYRNVFHKFESLQYNSRFSIYLNQTTNHLIIMACENKINAAKHFIQFEKIYGKEGDYAGMKVIDEIPARIQEDIVTQGRSYGILDNLSACQSMETITVFKVITEGHIKALKDTNEMKELVVGWEEFLNRITEIYNNTKMGVAASNLTKKEVDEHGPQYSSNIPQTSHVNSLMKSRSSNSIQVSPRF